MVPDLKIKVRLFVEPDGDGFHVYCPELKGLHVDGRTEEEAIERAREAVSAHVRSLLAHGDALPVGAIDTDDERAAQPRRILSPKRKPPAPKRRPATTRRHAHVEEVCIA